MSGAFSGQSSASAPSHSHVTAHSEVSRQQKDQQNKALSKVMLH